MTTPLRHYPGPGSGDSVGALKHTGLTDIVLEGDPSAQFSGTLFKNDWNSQYDVRTNDVFFAFLVSHGGDVATLTDNDAQLTWTKVTSFNNTTFGASVWVAVWRATVPTAYNAASDNHLVTTTGGTLDSAVVARVRGLNTSSPVVQFKAAQSANSPLTVTFDAPCSAANHVIAFQRFTSATTCTISTATDSFGSTPVLTYTSTGSALAAVGWSGFGALADAGIALELNG